MNNSTSYSEYKPSTDPQQFNVFWDEFLPESNEFTNGRAKRNNSETPYFLYEARSLSFPSSPANYQSYTFGTAPNQKRWIAYNGGWIPVSMTFSLPAPKTLLQVWKNGIKGSDYNPTNFTGENRYVDNNGYSYWGYGYVSSGTVVLSYAGVSGNAWHPFVADYYPNLYLAGRLTTGATFFNYPSICELKEVVIKERRLNYDKLVGLGSLVDLEFKKISVEEYDSTNLLGTVTSSAFNVGEQSIDLPGLIADQLKEDEFVLLIPKFFHLENNEGLPITTIPISVAYPYGMYPVDFTNRTPVIEYDRNGVVESSTRILSSFFRSWNVVFKNAGAGKYTAKKYIPKIEWDKYREYYRLTTLSFFGQYAYRQSLFDNPVELPRTWLTSSGSNMVFNVYRVKVNSRLQTGDEVSLVPARAPAEKLWSDYWGGSNDYNYFSWLDSRYVDLTANEITVQSEGYIEDFKTGTEVEVVGASNVIQGGNFVVVKQIFKTNQVLTATDNDPYNRYFITALNLSDFESILLTGQNIAGENGIYYVYSTSPVTKIFKDTPIFDRSRYSYYGGNEKGYFGNYNSYASVPTYYPSAGNVDTNPEAWRLDLYICVVKDYSEGHNGQLTVYKQMQPWNLYEGLPGEELVVTAKQRKRLESFYGNSNDGGFQGPAYLYNTGYTPSANNGWYAGSRYFASTFTELPDGLDNGGRYHLIRTGNKIKFANSYEDAIAGNAVPLKNVGKGAILIYRATANNTKAISKINTIDGAEVESLLPPSQSCFLIVKNNGCFQLAETKAKALLGEALRLTVEPNTFLKLEETTTDIQTGKYIWNPQEVTGLEPLNQKTAQVFYGIITSTDRGPTFYNSLFPLFHSETPAVDFIQGYKIRINLNLPEYDPLKMTNTPVIGTSYNVNYILGYHIGDVASPQYFNSNGSISTTSLRTMYPNVLPDPPLNTRTIDGIELTPIVNVAAHWEPLRPSGGYDLVNNSQISGYVGTTWMTTYANNKAVIDNMMTKTLAYLGSQDIYLDRNTMDEQIRYTIFGSANYSQDGLVARFTSFKQVYYQTGGPVTYDGVSSMRNKTDFEFFFGGITTSSYFKTTSHTGTTPLTNETSGDILQPGSTTFYNRYKSITTQGATTFVDDEGVTFFKVRLAVMYSIQKATGDEYLSLKVLPITGSDGTIYDGIYINIGEEKTYKKAGNVFVAITSGGGMLPSQLTLGDSYKTFDQSKSFKLDFSSQVVQTWRKHTMVANKVESPNYFGSTPDTINKLSQLTIQDYQQVQSDFAGPVVCSYKPAKKTWSSNSLSSNGVPFKIEVVPQIYVSGGFGSYYYYYVLSYGAVTVTIKIYSTPNVYKEFLCSTNTQIETYFPQDSTYTYRKPINNPNPPYNTTGYTPTAVTYSSNIRQRTGPAVLVLQDSIAGVAGESSSGTKVYLSSQADSNTGNSGIANNGHELLIAEDTIKSSGTFVLDDMFKAPWGHITGLYAQQQYDSYNYIQWAELWNITGSTKIRNLDIFATLPIFKTRPSVELVSQYGSGGEIELSFTQGNYQVGYLNKAGFSYNASGSKVIKSGKHYFSGAPTHTPQNVWFSGSTYQDYIKLSGTVYNADGSESQVQYRLSFRVRFFNNGSSSKFPNNRNPSDNEYPNVTSLGNSNFYSYYLWTAPSTYSFLAKGVDGETFMPGCPGPLAISHLTKVSIE